MSQSISFRKDITITVLLIDDEIKFLQALAKYLESRGIIVFIAQTTNHALDVLNNVVPDILVIDVMMPNQTGYDFVANLQNHKKSTFIPFIFLTAKGMTKDRIQGYRLGCRAYITKPFDPEELITIINSIVTETKDVNNIKKVSNEIRRIRLILESKNENYVQFTPREKEILFEIIQGNSNGTIGEKMKVSTRNVEKYVARLLNKTNTKNRIELVRFAYKFYQYSRANDENRTRE